MRTMSSRRYFLKQSGLLVAASSFSWPALAQGDPVVADTTYGRIRGTEVRGIKVFKGVPYGASTAGRTGSCRRSAPAKWTGVRDALAYGASAPQTRAGRTARCVGNRGGGRRAAGRGRGLPRAERLDAGGEGQPQAAGDVLVPRRRVRHRLGLVAGHRGRQPGAARRRGRGEHQPPPQRPRLLESLVGAGGGVRLLGRRRHARHRRARSSGSATTSPSSAATPAP